MIRNAQNNNHEICSPWISIHYFLNQYRLFRVLGKVFRQCNYFICSFFKYLWYRLTDKYTDLKRVNDCAHYIFKKHEDKFSFFKALVCNPRVTGAIFPSSRYLVREMVSHVYQRGKGTVIDLGSGTGVVTEALLQSGIKPANIIAIEYSCELTKKLRIRFPEVKIIQGNAADLTMLLNGNYSHPPENCCFFYHKRANRDVCERKTCIMDMHVLRF